MKKLFLLTIAAMFAACSNDSFNEEIVNPTDEVELVTLNFSPYKMESITRAAQAVSDFATHLDIWIIEGTNTIEYHQSSSTTGFGSLSITLNKTKTYTLYAVAHRCSGDASLSDGIITFPDNKVTASFFYSTTFSPATVTSLTCEMQRIVGQFRLEITDALPDEVTQMKFTVMSTGTTYNVSTGASGSPINKETLYASISKNDDKSANFTVTILPDNQTDTSNFDIKVEALNSSNEVIRERTFEDVPIKAGYKTTYAGAFFIYSDMSISFTANDWESFDTVNF